jgi:hypothetical protein
MAVPFKALWFKIQGPIDNSYQVACTHTLCLQAKAAYSTRGRFPVDMIDFFGRRGREWDAHTRLLCNFGNPSWRAGCMGLIG